MSDLADIKALLQARIEPLVRELAPEGKRNGAYWIAKNPARDDRMAGSFWVVIAGTAAGAWRDEATGQKGDVLSLVRHCQQLMSIKDALKWSRHWLGLEDLDPAVLERRKKQIARYHQRAAVDQEKKLFKKRRRAFSVWLNCWEKLDGTAAQRYLLTRGIDITKLTSQPRALRFAPNMDHIGADSARTRWPCIVARMENLEGNEMAIHRTWLVKDGSDKAPVVPPRKIWPSFRGLAIKLARGKTELPVKAAAARGMRDTLVLCEGIEDGLSVAIARPDLRVWAAGSLGNLQHIKIPACARDVIVCADNDWGKPQAEKLLKHALQELSAQGVPVHVARSPIGKDANDALRGMA